MSETAHRILPIQPQCPGANPQSTAMPRNPLRKPALSHFAAELERLLSVGQRPEGIGEPWTYGALAAKLTGYHREREGTGRKDRQEGYASPRTVSAWCKGTALPTEIEPVLRALFGPVRAGADRELLRGAFLAARAEKNRLAFARAKAERAGYPWLHANGRYVIDRTLTPSDELAAYDDRNRQFQEQVRHAAREMADTARRRNTDYWDRLARTANRFHALLGGPPPQLLDDLAAVYALTLDLGEFLAADKLFRSADGEDHDLLDAEGRQRLSQLVRLSAIWMRAFPSAVEWDEKAAAAAAPPDLLPPSDDVIGTALRRADIAARDADELQGLRRTADGPGAAGRKAGTRFIASTRNLILAAIRVATADPSSAEAKRAVEFLAEARMAVGVLTHGWPEDLRHALDDIIDQARADGDRPSPPAPTIEDEPIPEDVEDRARQMILAGQAPPLSWTPAIIRLSFDFDDLSDLAPIAGLAFLQSLNLTGTQVSDLAPIAGLASLQSLDLMNTQVSDLAPIAGLAFLQSLDLMGTQVSDLAPIAGLASLQSLDLAGTQVSDLAPIAGLASLQFLNLMGTQVSDLAPTASLTSLRSLDLDGTQVNDLTPIAGLASLQSLDVSRTTIADFSPLSGIHNLTIHGRDGRPVTAPSPARSSGKRPSGASKPVRTKKGGPLKGRPQS